MRTQIMSLLLVLSLGAGAQEDEPLQTYLREVMTAEDVESSTWEDVYDQLCYLSQHPFDLNTATRSQLEDLPFLSAQQIEELMDYLYHYGPMKSKGELLMIRSLDEARRKLLGSVCYVGEASSKPFPFRQLNKVDGTGPSRNAQNSSVVMRSPHFARWEILAK